MKLDHSDRPALEQLTCQEISAYLTQRGWQRTGLFRNQAILLEHPDPGSGEPWEVTLPIESHYVDYADRIAELIATVARVENRTQSDVFHDLSGSGNDLIRLRAPQADALGTIGIADGVALFDSAQKLLAAAACATVKQGPSFHPGKIAQVRDYLETVKLGQTERGSYVLTILSPVNPAFKHPEQQELDLTDPFPRQVTRKLAGALHATEAALGSARATGEFQAFAAGIQQGLSANLCEALANLARHGRGIDIGLRWARTRPIKQADIRVRFGVETAGILEEAAREYRRTMPTLDESLVGMVISLEREPEQFDGNATLRTTIDGSYRRVRVTFPTAMYAQVIDAFKNQLPLQLDGDLHPRGHRYELRNPRNLLVLDDGED